MRTRKIVQSVSAGIVLGGEAIGAIVLHESHSLAVAAPAVIVAIILTAWFLDSGLDWCVKRWGWAANIFGVKPGSKVKIHGYWYSAIRNREGRLLGGSVFFIHAGINDVELTGIYRDFTVEGDSWAWWSGEGTPFREDSILYGYGGEEDGGEDEGFGMYSFPRGSPHVVRGSFYGRNLPKTERYRTAHGIRVPKADLTRSFRREETARKRGLERYLENQPKQIG